MRKVFLDNLPKKLGFGANKDKLVVDWNKCVGFKVSFIYDDDKGELLIVEVTKDNNHYKIKLKYNNNIHILSNSSLINANLENVLEKVSSDYKYQVDDIIEINGIAKLKILKQIRINKTRGYKYQCLICNHVDERIERLIDKCDCVVCSGRKVLKGFNDLWTTNPEIAKLLKNKEVGYQITSGSTRKEILICDNCNAHKEQMIINVIKQGFSCPKCGDGISYPEKFMFSVLEQLIGDSFTPQIKFVWSENKKYDFYIESLNIIIETHGMQHYRQTNIGKGLGRNLIEEQENDIFKEKLAMENGIKNYIVINCSESSLDYMKNSILNSQLSEIFDLSNIDWFQCHDNACSNLIKRACDLWNNEIQNTKTIAEILNISRKTIIDYLKKGSQSNMCNYNASEEMNKNNRKSGEKKKRRIICLNTGVIYNSIADATRALNKTSRSHICECCSGKLETAYLHPETGEPLKWMYYEDYLK